MGNRQGRKQEEGGLLIILMVGVAVASIALTVAVQAWSTTWRRDSEEELIFRGQQYANAILAYQKEHGGQYPLNLEELNKPGPRRLRYIRKLFKEPIARDHKWGLLYLAPGGQSVYDPKAAQQAQKKAHDDGWDSDDTSAGGGTAQQGGLPQPGGLPAGYTPIRGMATTGAGVPSGAGPLAGAPPGSIPMMSPPVPPTPAGGADDEERVSEPPLGWPIVGVISRATGKASDVTLRVYKGHTKVDEWQFLAFDQGGEQPQLPGTPTPMFPQMMGVGPGYGGKPTIMGLGPGAQPWGQRGRPPFGGGNNSGGQDGGPGGQRRNPQDPNQRGQQ